MFPLHFLHFAVVIYQDLEDHKLVCQLWPPKKRAISLHLRRFSAFMPILSIWKMDTQSGTQPTFHRISQS